MVRQVKRELLGTVLLSLCSTIQQPGLLLIDSSTESIFAYAKARRSGWGYVASRFTRCAKKEVTRARQDTQTIHLSHCPGSESAKIGPWREQRKRKINAAIQLVGTTAHGKPSLNHSSWSVTVGGRSAGIKAFARIFDDLFLLCCSWGGSC